MNLFSVPFIASYLLAACTRAKGILCVASAGSVANRCSRVRASSRSLKASMKEGYLPNDTTRYRLSYMI